MSTDTITAKEAARLVDALNNVSNSYDIESALGLFTPDAVVQTLPPPPSGQAVWSGREQVRAFLRWQADEHFHVTSSNLQVSGTTITWNSTVGLDSFRQMGLPTVEVLVEAVVRDGKMCSFTGTLSPETQQKIEAAMQQGHAVSVAAPS
ncbi:MAG: hypothetical protein NVS2B7_08570 [Herpetosiphon sp.]